MNRIKRLKDHGLIAKVASEAVGHTSPGSPVTHVNESDVDLVSARIDVSIPVDKAILGDLDN